MNVFGLKWTDISVSRLLSVLPTGLPTQTQTDLLLLWILHLRNLIYLKVEIALLGNFNIDFGAVRDRRSRQAFWSFLVAHGLHQIITKPTIVSESSKTTIICVDNAHRVVQWDVILAPFSDHSIILCLFKSGTKKLPPRTFESRSFKNYDYELRTMNYDL